MRWHPNKAHFPHWMFKPEGLEALLRHVCGAEGEDAIATSVSSIMPMRRLLGCFNQSL
tara:strand:+ start:895 stop:1068 length:174 start_codon:yes stop_codon:yes gene_type:complete